MPIDAQVLQATLHIYAGAFQNGDTTFHVVKSTADLPLSNADFGDLLFTSGGSATSSSPNEWLEIELSSAALDWIEAGGTTRLALVHDFDLHDVQPTVANDLLVGLAEHSSSPPYLEIKYSPP